MLEWHCVIRAGRSRLRLRFEGGALSGYGVTPATYITANPAVQHIIEHSDYFRSGRIRLLRCREEREEREEREKREKRAVSTWSTGSDAVNSTFAEVSVRNMQQARDYLVEKCGIDRTAIMTGGEINAAAKQYGIKFLYKR